MIKLLNLIKNTEKKKKLCESFIPELFLMGTKYKPRKRLPKAPYVPIKWDGITRSKNDKKEDIWLCPYGYNESTVSGVRWDKMENTAKAHYEISPINPSIEHMRKALDDIESGKVTKYIFGWRKDDMKGSVIITSNDLSGLKTPIRNAITEPRK